MRGRLLLGGRFWRVEQLRPQNLAAALKMGFFGRVMLILMVWAAIADAQIPAPQVVVMTDNTVVSPGDTAILVCVATGPGDITWLRNNQIVSNTSLVSIREENFTKAFTVFRQSSLRICTASGADEGTYTCVIRAGAASSRASTNVTVLGLDTAMVFAISDLTRPAQGETAVLTCLAYGRPRADITWTFNDQPVTNSSLVIITEDEAIVGGTLLKRSFLQICSVLITNGGNYTCTVTNGVVSDSATTQLALLGIENVGLVVLSDSTTVDLGETVLLSCTGYGIPTTTISWTLNGQPLTNSSLLSIYENSVFSPGHFMRQSFLEICSATSAHGGTYTCTISNTLIDVFDSTQLTVTGREFITLGVLSEEAIAAQNDAVVFFCLGAGIPDVDVTWRLNNEIVSNSSLVTIYDINYPQPGGLGLIRESTLEICGVRISDTGEYECTVSGGLYMSSGTTRLDLIGAEDAQLVAISDTAYLFGGETIVHSCVGWGRSTVDITWEYNGLPIVNTTLVNTSEVVYTHVRRQFKQSYLQICNINRSNVGEYRCILNSPLVTIEATTQVVLSDAALLAISSDTTINQRDTATLLCMGYSSATVPSVTWTFNNQTVTNSALVTVYDQVVQIGILTVRQSLIQICSSSIAQSGVYTCTINDGQVSIQNTTQLTINGQGEVDLLVVSNSTTIRQGQTALLTCIGWGEPEFQITWSRNGQTEMNTSLISIYEREFFHAGRLLRQSFLEICSAALQDIGLYTCNVSNGIIHVAGFIRFDLFGSDDIQLMAISDTSSVSEGDTAVLLCIGRGTPEVDINWLRNGQPVVTSPLVSITQDNSSDIYTQSFLEICGIRLLDSGDYVCVVNTSVISVEETTELGVSYVEVSAITNHTVVAQGETVVITCVGYAQPNVSSITWTFNDEPVVNSSLVFVLPDVSFVNKGRQYTQSRLQICSFYEEMVGDYGCTVSNGDITASAITELSLFGLDNVNRVAISEPTFVAAGNESAVLICVGFGLPLVQLSWTHYDRPITNSPSTFVTGGTFFTAGRNYQQSFLHICGPDVTDSGPYTCVFTNQHVTVGLSTEVIVTTPPIAEVSAISDHMTINEGETTILTCVGYGKPDVEIMWTFNDENLENKTDTSVVNVLEESGGILKVLRLEICGARKTDSGIYTCTVSNEEVTASAQTQLTIRGAEIIDLVVLSEDTTLYEGETTLLSCVGFGEPSLAISWTFNNEPVVNTSLISVFEDVFFQAGRLFTHSFLQICSDNVADTGLYTCSITNGLVSLNASLELTFGGAEAVRVIAVSEDSEVATGDTAVLTCITYNQPGITISWTHDGDLVANTSLVFISEESQGLYKQSFLQICATRIRDYGSYRCIVSNGFVSAHADTIMSVPGVGNFELVLISNDTDILVRETIVLLCVGYGEPDVEITWSRNDQAIMNSSLTTILESDSFQAGKLIRQSLLEICDAEMTDAGTYVCTVDVGHLETSYQVNLGVNRPPVTLEIPRLLIFTRNEKDSIMFQCRAQGSPLPQVSWFKDSNPLIPSGTIQITSGTNLDGEGIPTVSSILTVSDLTPSDAGNYTCRAFNNRASVSLDMPYVLTVTPVVINYCSPDPCQNNGRCISEANSFRCNCTDGWSGMICDIPVTERTPPTLITQPEDLIVSLRSRANFSCVATGNPSPAIQWFKDDSLIPGETSSMLVIDQVSLNDRGFYYCIATNSEGVANSMRAVLNIRGIFQFVLPVTLSVAGVGPFQEGEVPSDEVIMTISGIVDGLKNDAVNQPVGTNPEYIVFDVARAGSVTTVSSTGNVGVFMTDILATLLDSSGTPVPPSDSVLQEVADLIERLGSNRQFNVQEESIRRFDACTLENETLTVSDTMRGVIDWTEGLVGFTATSRCPCDLVPVPRHASRVCGGDFTTGGVWMPSNTSACGFDEHSFQLCDATSMDEVATLSEDVERTTALGIIILTLSIEQNAVNASGNLNASNQLLDIIDNVQKVSLVEMKNSQEEFNSSSRIRGQLDRLLETYPITNTPQLVVRDMFGCSLYPDLGNAVLSFSPALGDTIQLEAAPTPNLTITLPETLVADAGFSTPLSLAFCGYKSESLFVRRESYLKDSGRANLQLASGVVSARPATNQRVTGLTENVKMTFVKNEDNLKTQCSYWEQSLDGGYGGWSEEGCQLVKETGDDVMCECDHLTNFVLLTDESFESEPDIQVYTIIGVGVAFVCVLMVLISTLISSKVRSSALGISLINLCIALLCLYVTYIISNFVGNSVGGCRFFSFLFHYLILVSSLGFSIMAFFSGWTPSSEHKGWTPCSGRQKLLSFLTAILLNWIIPLVVVIISIAADVDNYSPINTAHFCRPVSGAYWFGILMLGGFIIVLTTVFLIIAPIFVKTGYVKPKSTQSDHWFTEYLGLVIVTVFFFVAWAFGIPAMHPLNLGVARVIFQVIFLACNILQGLVMVLCYCQKVWRAYTLPGGDNIAGSPVEDNAYAMSDEGLLFENPLAESVTDMSPPDYDAVNFDFEEEEAATNLDDAIGEEEVKGDLGADDLKEDLMGTFD